MKAAVLARTRGMTREEWLAARRQGIGSSDAAAVARLDPFKSPVDVWLDKTGQVRNDTPSLSAEIGRELEDFVARKFAEREGVKVRRVHAILHHPHLPWMIADVDRVVVGGGILECKVTRHAKWWEDGRAPDHYIVQVQHQLAVTGEERGWLVALILGGGLEVREIRRDDALIDELIAVERDFWENYVLTGQMPPVDGSPASSAVLERLYPESTSGKVALLPLDEAQELIEQYRVATERIRDWEQQRDEAANRLKALMGDAEIGLIAGKPAVRWTTVRSSRLDTKALREAHPDIAQAFTREQTYRRFSLVEQEEAS